MKSEAMYFFLYSKEVKTSFCLFLGKKGMEKQMLQSIHSVVKKQIFGKDRKNAVVNEGKKSSISKNEQT